MELNELLKKVVDSIDRRNDKKFKKLGVAIGKNLNKLILLLKEYYKDEWIRKIEDFTKNLREERLNEDIDLLFEQKKLYEIYKNK